MQANPTVFKIKGMDRDTSPSSFSNTYAFNIRNLRLSSIDGTNLSSWTVEKGNTFIYDIIIEGTVLGVINTPKCKNQYDGFVVFHKQESIDYISLIIKEEDVYKKYPLFKGNLDLDLKHPIEGLYCLETENIKKIYWTDNKNQIRFLNIVQLLETPIEQSSDDTNVYFLFDSALTLPGIGEISVEKENSDGTFPAGVIQYAYSIFKKHASESSLIQVSPLNYISYLERGASPEDTVSCKFKITINNIPDEYFTGEYYIKLYSILRTSQNNVPQTSIVQEIALTEGTDTITYTDTGLNNTSVDPTELSYLGSELITCKTMNQKDNTLFLGNITLQKSNVNISDTLQPELITEYLDGNKIILGGTSSERYPYYNSLNNSNITYFKKGEQYRLGVQLQDKYGKWGDPIFIKDYIPETNPVVEVNSDIKYNNVEIKLPSIEIRISGEKIQGFYEQGFRAIRPVCVFPDIYRRKILCQGIIQPTVANIETRLNGSCYAQSSWLVRPTSIIGQRYNDETVQPIDQKWSIAQEHMEVIGYTGQYLNNLWPVSIPEIQCNFDNVVNGTNILRRQNLEDYGDFFFVDKSILTINTPEAELGEDLYNIDLKNYDIKVIGYTWVTNSFTNIDIQTKTGPGVTKSGNHIRSGKGFLKKTYTFHRPNGIYEHLVKGITDVYYNDTQRKLGGTLGESTINYYTYLWQRSGSLSNDDGNNDNTKTSDLQSKKQLFYMSCLQNKYFEDDEQVKLELSDTKFCSLQENSPIKLDLGIREVLYKGSTDQLLTFNFDINRTPSKQYGYPVAVEGLVDSNYIYMMPGGDNFTIIDNDYGQNYTGDDKLVQVSTDSVRMKYKSTPHIVTALKRYIDVNTLYEYYFGDSPHVNINNTTIPNILQQLGNDILQWDKDLTNVNSISYIPCGELHPNTLGINQSSLIYIVELHRKTEEDSIFGEYNEYSKLQYSWVPCGDSVPIKRLHMDEMLFVKYTQGDTYFQRFDSLKTYPFTIEDPNCLTNVISFMCETKINIDGRYDTNRGSDNLAMSPVNFNLINPIYSQQNNFFSYRAVDDSISKNYKFPNQITWTKTKYNGELIDNWMHITLASTLDLDGDKGEINKIEKFNNNLVAFQDTGIANINYNENVALTATNGVPVELANSGKVTGKTYLSTSVGAFNKQSIVNTEQDIIFIDDNTRELYSLATIAKGSFSRTLNMHSYFYNQNNYLKEWTLEDPSNFKLFYDKQTKDIYIVNVDNCLAYSLVHGGFTSFYDYENTPYFINIGNDVLAIKIDENGSWLYNQYKGDYGDFFNIQRPYSIEIIANNNGVLTDSIWETIESKVSVYNDLNVYQDSEFMFNHVYVNNDYQSSDEELYWDKSYPSNLKKKFNIWRINIPRSKRVLGRMKDRIRSPWVKIKLEGNSSNKGILHDLILYSYQ